nr:hypothetical protein [Bdellovibrionales bacterium]
MTRYLLFAALALNLGACVSKTVGEFKPPEKLTGDTVTVLTFNVENLFDLEDDPDKNDEAFLPPNLKANAGFENRCRAQNSGRYMYECLEKTWTRNLLDRKMKRLTDVLAQVGDGRGPDILILQEIENEKVLREWRDKHLAKMNYQTLVLLEGPDERGIDTAILSRFPQIDTAKLHFIDFKKDEAVVKVAADSGREIRDSRSILEARLRLPNDQRLAVFAVHFPSQGANTAFRKYAMQTLLDVTAAVPAGTEVIVG